MKYLNQISSIIDDVDEARFSEYNFCPYCEYIENIVKFLKNNVIQIYKCKNCNATFSSLTKTVFARHRNQYIFGRNISDVYRIDYQSPNLMENIKMGINDINFIFDVYCIFA